MKGLYVIKIIKTQGHLVQVIHWSSLMGLAMYEADSRSAIKKVQHVSLSDSWEDISPAQDAFL